MTNLARSSGPTRGRVARTIVLLAAITALAVIWAQPAGAQTNNDWGLDEYVAAH